MTQQEAWLRDCLLKDPLDLVTRAALADCIEEKLYVSEDPTEEETVSCRRQEIAFHRWVFENEFRPGRTKVYWFWRIYVYDRTKPRQSYDIGIDLFVRLSLHHRTSPLRAYYRRKLAHLAYDDLRQAWEAKNDFLLADALKENPDG